VGKTGKAFMHPGVKSMNKIAGNARDRSLAQVLDIRDEEHVFLHPLDLYHLPQLMKPSIAGWLRVCSLRA
jgi:hypothetical protein